MSAKFWFYPVPAGNRLVEIDIGEGIAELFSDYRKDVSSGISLDGTSYRSVGLTQEIITIQRDRMILGEDLAHQFHSLQNHLDRGYVCSFTSDHTKAWCGSLVSSPANSGSTVLSVGSNPFSNFVGSNVLSSDDYVVFETQPPAAVRETNKVASLSAGFSASNGGNITLSRGLDFRYSSQTFVRWYRFFPVLKRVVEDVNTPIITNEHGAMWSLSIRLFVDYAGWFAFAPPSREKLDMSLPEMGEIRAEYEAGGGGIDEQIQSFSPDPTHGGGYETEDVEAYDPDLHGE